MAGPTDPRSSGVPEVGDLEASLEADGSLSQVTCTAQVPNGELNDRLQCTFGVEDGVATLDMVTEKNRAGDDGLGNLWVGTHLPGILAAEMAVSDLEQIRDVVGLESLLDEASTQAEYGYRFECPDCGHKSWGKWQQRLTVVMASKGAATALTVGPPSIQAMTP